MDGATITPYDLEAIYDDIRTNCAIYTEEVAYGVRIALSAVEVQLVRKLREERNT